jgi:hypothetical protein
MPKIDPNLDAYRIVAECLHRVRQLLRDALRVEHGDSLDEESIPAELRGYLTQRRAREASINWHLMDSCDLLDYAGFANIYDIIATNPGLMDRFASLAPDPNVLRIRFLELDTILNRIAYVRSVSDTEMGFLVSFDERLRRLPSESGQARGAARGGKEEAATTSPAAEPAKLPASSLQDASEPASPPRSKASEPPPGKEKEREKGKAIPPPVAAESAPKETGKAATGREKPAPAPVNGKDVQDALRDGNEPNVLSALYHEITALADGLWSQAAPAAPKVWEQVRESTWYQEHFASLGLKPVSDFYALVDEARDRLLAGTSRSDIQEFLKERNFAQVLLSLRELFKHHLTN